MEPKLFTITCDSHILIVVAVVDAPSVASALTQGCLPPLAVHIIQEDGPAPLAKGEGSWHGDSMAATQLATHHIGIHDVPVIITYCAPGAIVEDLHTPLAAALPFD